MGATLSEHKTVRKQLPAKQVAVRNSPIPKAIRQQAERILAEDYPYMDSVVFHKKNAEAQLFSEDGAVPELPLTSWYQPTREEMLESGITGAPKLMSAAEE